MQVESASARPAKGDLVRRTVLAQVEEFTLADLSAQLPTASRQLIKKVLAGLKKGGKVRLAGRGRSARGLSSHKEIARWEGFQPPARVVVGLVGASGE